MLYGMLTTLHALILQVLGCLESYCQSLAKWLQNVRETFQGGIGG